MHMFDVSIPTEYNVMKDYIHAIFYCTRWHVEEWSPCNCTLDERNNTYNGNQRRSVYCSARDKDKTPVEDQICFGLDKPISNRRCYSTNCGYQPAAFYPGRWSEVGN